LAPNLAITQYTATDYVAGARGFAGAQEAQNFSNKLLILIDGRSVYSPLYSGVYLDAQDLLLDDVDRIEVISGAGATLWGANAMNGVINIITRPAYLNDRSMVSGLAGNMDRTLSGRFAARPNEAWSYRAYGKAFKRGSEDLADGTRAGDGWDKAQGGFRTDWTGEADSFTAQGDLYSGSENEASAGAQNILGDNVLARWKHRAGAGEWQLQSYYDYTDRDQTSNASGFALRTYDTEFQQTIGWGRNRLIWGAGYRLHRYHIADTQSLLFDPPDRSLLLANLFAQDTVALSASLDLTLGLKLERDPFSGWTPLPDARLSWRVGEDTSLWTAAARAIRAPTPFDHDVIEKFGAIDYLVGNKAFKPEEVDAYEAGVREQAAAQLSVSVSAFYNVYHDLRTVEEHSDTAFVPLSWGNRMEGHTYGTEAWAQWQVAGWWRLSPGLRLLNKQLRFTGSSPPEPLGLEQSGDDPHAQALLTSSMDVGSRSTLDLRLRYTGSLPNPRLASYAELGATFDRQIGRRLDVSIVGLNLLRDRHLEYPAPSGEYIRRSLAANVRWRF
jgi:iron complex outermembrane receptor protein